MEPKGKKARQESLQIAFQRSEIQKHEKLKAVEEGILRKAINPDAFYEALVQLLANHDMPWNAVTWPEFQALLMTCNYMVEDILVESGSTVPKLLEDSFVVHKATLKKKLQRSRSLVHFSVDLWTSEHRKAYLAIVSHWVDECYQLRKALLALPRLRHSHGGELQARHFLDTIRDYNLWRNLGYCTSDNATSNDNLLRQLSKGLLEEYQIEYHPVHRRIRCSGHIINLSLQAFLFAKNKEALRAAEEAAADEDTLIEDELVNQAIAPRQPNRSKGKGKGKQKEEDKAAGWRSIGALGELTSRLNGSYADYIA